MVDKLSFMKSLRSLRRSFKIFPVLCPILIGPLFHHGFHTNDGLDFLSAHGHGPVRPVRPRLLVLSPSAAPFTLFDPSLLCKGVNWGDGQNNPDSLMFMGRQIETYIYGDKFELG